MDLTERVSPRTSEKRRPSAVERPSASDDTSPVLIWNVLKWILAFAIGLVVLSDGSYVLFHLVNPLGSRSQTMRPAREFGAKWSFNMVLFVQDLDLLG